MSNLPKPYYQDEQATIYHGDCRDILPLLEPVDLVLTDPPYNIGFSGYLDYKDNLSPEEYIGMLNLLKRFTNIVVSQYPEETMRFIVPALGPAQHVSAWCYHALIPRRFRLISYYGITPEYNRILQPYRNVQDKRILSRIANGSMGTPLYEWWDDIELVKNVSHEKTEHPCPLPEKLVGRIVILTTNEGQTILDPFMGSGTTLRAARDLGRKSIGIEIERAYCDIAVERLRQSVLPIQDTMPERICHPIAVKRLAQGVLL